MHLLFCFFTAKLHLSPCTSCDDSPTKVSVWDYNDLDPNPHVTC